MRTTSLSFRSLSPCLASPRSFSVPCWTRAFASRRYATHRGAIPSSLLSQSLDQKTRETRGNVDSVGPFPLGISQPYLNHGETVKKWSELSTGGKVVRTTARMSNLTVILFGAGLSAVLVYALTTELFSNNSPTVLYTAACDKIKASSEVARYLHGPLSFHNNPPSAVRPRHRNRHVSSQIFLDSAGREHMRLEFYVQGRPPGSPPPKSSYFDALVEWARTKAALASEVTLDEAITWVKECAEDVRDTSKELFRYLSGAPLPRPPSQATLPSTENSVPEKEEIGAWSFAGLFTGLRGPKSRHSDPSPPDNSRVWTDGAVHAQLVRNHQGYFTFEYIYIDMPNSRARNPKRVFVERSL